MWWGGGMHGWGSMHGRGHAWQGACMVGGMHGGGMCGRGCVVGACMFGMHGGHAWQGMCMAGGHVWQGACVHGGEGVCKAGGHAWQERQPLQWTLCILLECILASYLFT